MPSMRYTTVLFDFDHTLFDSDASEAASLATTLHAHGVDDPASHYNTYRQINRALWHEVERGTLRPDEVGPMRFEQLAAASGLDADPTAMAATYLEALGANGDLFPGARAMLEDLASRSSLAMVTNAVAAVQRARIERLGLAALFDAIVISSEVGVAKPHRAIFDITLDHLDTPDIRRTLMVGDSLSSDIRGGTNAGIATCWYNPGRGVADASHTITHEISMLAELPTLVTDDPSDRL